MINSEKEIVGKCILLFFCLKKDKIYFKMNYLSATFQTQGNILYEKYIQVDSHVVFPE